MLRFGYLVMVGSFVACSLFACGDKLNPKGNAPTAAGGTTGAGGATGAGGTTDLGGVDGGDSEAGVAIDGGVGAGGATGGTGGVSGAGGSTTAAVSYKNTIAPIMAKSCATSSTCHASGDPWGVDLDTYAGVKSNAAASISAIKGGTMPPSGTISAADLKSLQDWVNAGSPNN
jgi:hypothetical protein